MTVPELVQLYAPLAGLLGVVFWLGVLSERVRRMATDIKGLHDSQDDSSEDHDLLIELRTNVHSVLNRLDSFDRAMQGVQRQLGNLMLQGAGGKVVEMSGQQ